jgi:protein-S-isoprenylcysteine O-methyltransferase Ste14
MPSTVGPVIKTLIFTVLVPGTVAVYVPYRLLSPGSRPVGTGLELIGILPVVAGAAVYFRCAWDFASVGHGTPAPIDPPKTLIVTGLNRFVRNPMYVGVDLVILGEAMLFRRLSLLIYAVCVWLAFHLFVVLYEEPHLRKKFGGAYEAYCREVPRWIPKFNRARASR